MVAGGRYDFDRWDEVVISLSKDEWIPLVGSKDLNSSDIPPEN